MRLHYTLLGAVCLLGLYPLLAVSSSGGAPPTANGSPVSLAAGGVGLCTACHGGAEPNSGTGSVTIDAPETFVPGETLSFTVTVDNTTPPVGEPRQGFEVSVENDAAVEHVGTLVVVEPETTRFASNGAEYVTHTSAGSAVTSWTVGWTAPVDAPETVTIYAAGNAANGDFSPAGDFIYTASVTLQRSTVSAEPAAPVAARLLGVYPNPAAGRATADLALERSQPVTLTLYDGLGRAVRRHDLGVLAGEQAADLDLDGLPAGLYFLEVRTPGATTTRPLTVAR